MKEFAIEKTLNDMVAAWEGCDFEVMPYRNTGTGVIKLTEEVNSLLDDHIVLTQQFSFSPYKGPFEERIADWERKLRLVQEVTSEWLGCQRNWMYLQPIFDSEDINRQLPQEGPHTSSYLLTSPLDLLTSPLHLLTSPPTSLHISPYVSLFLPLHLPQEGKRFTNVDRQWRKTLDKVQAAPQIITFCDNEELKEQWIKSNAELERVQKNLADYLETKRTAFARFYFLSNDELLEILSQTKVRVRGRVRARGRGRGRVR